MESAPRSVPHSPEAERAVLGGMLLDPSRIPTVQETLKAEDFYRSAHQKLYELMSSMHLEGDPVELVAVVEAVSRSTKVDEYGGLAYVAGLADDVPSSENIGYYARLVSERATERRANDKRASG